MINEKLISVIVPVFNTELYLRRCINSIINQSYSCLEIICVNDGSTDSSLDILKEYEKSDNRVRVFSQENSGLSESRNLGLKYANGELISFIDSDDWIESDFYEHLVNSLNSTNSDIAMGVMQRVSQSEVLNRPDIMTGSETKYWKIIKQYPNGSVCDKLFNVRLFKNNEIKFIKGRYYEDNLVLLQLTKNAKKVSFVNSAVYNYFFNEKSITRDVSIDKEKKRNEDKIFMIRQIMNFAKKERLSYFSMFEVKRFCNRTIAGNFYSKESEYYSEICKLFGFKFVVLKKIKSGLSSGGGYKSTV